MGDIGCEMLNRIPRFGRATTPACTVVVDCGLPWAELSYARSVIYQMHSWAFKLGASGGYSLHGGSYTCFVGGTEYLSLSAPRTPYSVLRAL